MSKQMNWRWVAVLLAAGALGGCYSQVRLSPDYGVAVRQDVVAQVADPDARYAGTPQPGSVNQQLHFVTWNAKEIANEPVTHVSMWAKTNDVDITKNYLREDREGGLDAVGSGFPGIKREDLMVLPDSDWLDMKDRLTYVAWAQKTMAAETQAAGVK